MEEQGISFRQWFRWGVFAAGWAFVILSMFVLPKDFSMLRQFTLGGLGLLIGCAFVLLQRTKHTLPEENPMLYWIGAYCWGSIGALFILGVLK